MTNEPPFQTMVPALVPVSVTEVVVQDKFPLEEAVTVGGVVLEVTVTVAVAVQPLVPSVAVTVYVPAAVAVAGSGALTNEPPFQTIVEPGLVPVNVTEVLVHVIVPLAAAVTVGGVVLDVIVTVAVFVHPAALVAVTV